MGEKIEAEAETQQAKSYLMDATLTDAVHNIFFVFLNPVCLSLCLLL